MFLTSYNDVTFSLQKLKTDGLTDMTVVYTLTDRPTNACPIVDENSNEQTDNQKNKQTSVKTDLQTNIRTNIQNINNIQTNIQTDIQTKF